MSAALEGSAGGKNGSALSQRIPRYRVARDCRLHKEIDLGRQMEALAMERRALKAGERDYLNQDEKGGQDASLQAFRRGKDRVIGHFWSFRAAVHRRRRRSNAAQPRHGRAAVEFHDMTPEGRSDWDVGIDDHNSKEPNRRLPAGPAGAL
jgi:predicted dithiol-disulfide oxidoreductase (DUF899 family)